MSKYILTQNQEADLKALFSHISDEEFDTLIWALKEYLEGGGFDNNIKGDNTSRTIHIKKQSALLKDIARQAQKLKTLINGLDKSCSQSIEVQLAYSILEKVRNKGKIVEIIDEIKSFHQTIPEKERHITNRFAQYLEESNYYTPQDYEDNFDALIGFCDNIIFDDLGDLKTTDHLDVWIDESIGYAILIENEFGSGYLESFLHAATTNWTHCIKLPIKASESSLFIKYLAILLETSSTEKLSKMVYRSSWFKKNEARINFTIKTGNGLQLNKNEIVEKDKINKLEKEYEQRMEQQIKNMIDKIKNN